MCLLTYCIGQTVIQYKTEADHNRHKENIRSIDENVKQYFGGIVL